MPCAVYTINKGINRPVEFRGLRAQYIGYLGAGLLVLLVLFAGLYISGVNAFLCVAITFLLGVLLFAWIYKLNNRYGPHGLMKRMARRKMPRVIKARTRKSFTRPGKPAPQFFY